MKLKHFAISAFALSMGAALAAGNATDMQIDKNKPATAAENKVNGSTAVTGSTVAVDTSTSTTASTDLATGKDKRADNAPAGYADKSAAAAPRAGQKDTKKAQKKAKKETVARADLGTSANGSTVAATGSAKAETPAGYADKSTGDKKNQQKDTEKAQVQPDAGIGATAAAPAQSGAPAGYSDQSSAATGSQPQDTQKAQSK